MTGLVAADLSITADDVYIVQSPEGGYHLYIRNKPDIKSVLITESTQDPAKQNPAYAYRSDTYNPINGDEQRILNGEFIPKEKKLFSLIDSSVEYATPFGAAFHIWIPFVIEYGYTWSRIAHVQVLDGTFLNIRAFAKPYADYTGGFADNPFKLHLTQEPVTEAAVILPDKYMDKTLESFSKISHSTAGSFLKAASPKEIVPLIENELQAELMEDVDILFIIDATASMKDDILELRAALVPMLKRCLADYRSYRIGLILYKDYHDDFLVKKTCAFTDDFSTFEKSLKKFRVSGGKDIPEAVYEGLFEGLTQSWRTESNVAKKIFLIGDAPPHPIARGDITKENVYTLADEKGVAISAIILPHGETH